MNAEQFAMWAQGMLEYRKIMNGGISHQEALEMLQGIKDHVALVFNKVTPELPKEEYPKIENRPINWEKLKEHMKPHSDRLPESVPLPKNPWVIPQDVWPGKVAPYQPPAPGPFWLHPEKNTVMC